jgi:hypothetical protein
VLFAALFCLLEDELGKSPEQVHRFTLRLRNALVGRPILEKLTSRYNLPSDIAQNACQSLALVPAAAQE